MTASVHLSKHHGLGNDFLIALSERNETCEPDRDRARSWCDRHRGIGADGLIWYVPSARGDVDGRMILHNSDGSDAEISGNGIRCLAQAIARARGMQHLDLRVETAAGDRILNVTPGAEPSESWVDAGMGAVDPGPPAPDVAALGVPGARLVATGNVGNPHLVVWADDAWTLDPSAHGPRIEAMFEGGINVHFIDVVAPNRISMRIWERGAGVTGACGSGATVAAHWATTWSMVGGGVVEVEMPGGVASLRPSDAGGLTLGSAVVHIAEIEITEELP